MLQLSHSQARLILAWLHVHPLSPGGQVIAWKKGMIEMLCYHRQAAGAFLGNEMGSGTHR